MNAPFVIGEGLRGSVTRVWEKPQTTTHTPAPWEVSIDRGHHVVIKGDRVMAYTGAVGGSDEQESIANAHLIAAAPELLKVLSGYVQRQQAHNATLLRPSPDLSDARLGEAIAAISKATGGAV